MRWIVDGMNVIGTRPDAWWRDRHGAMVGLVRTLERWAASGGEHVTVVFEQPPAPPIRSTVIEVAHAPRPRRDSADDEIVRLVRADPEPGAVRVVTSDDAMTATIHAELERKDLLPAEHIVDTGYVDAKLLVESQRDYQIDLVGPTRRNHQWQGRRAERL